MATRNFSRPLPSSRTTVLLGLLAFVQFSFVQPAKATIIISPQADGALFTGDTTGDSAGPFTDPATNVMGSIYHNLITDAAGNPDGVLSFGGTQNGIDSNAITLLESWTFSWDVNTQFMGIDFSSLESGFQAQIQSNGWIGASITPGNANVNFVSETGTFQFNGDEGGDDFLDTLLYGSSDIPIIAAGTTFTLSQINGGDYSIGATDFRWNLVSVPQPAAGTLLPPWGQ